MGCILEIGFHYFAGLCKTKSCWCLFELLKVVTEISESMQAPIAKWVEKGVTFKFVGDNVDKHRGVRDIRSDNHSKLIHMYSLLAVKSRVCIPDMMTIHYHLYHPLLSFPMKMMFQPLSLI